MSSCQEPPPSKDNNQQLLLNFPTDPASFDPRAVRLQRDLTLMKQLYEGLMRLDAQGAPQLALAEKIEISNDLLTYSFTLREAFWSNGDPISAEDFKRSWQEALDPSFACDYAYMLYPIKNGRQIREGKLPVDSLGVTVLAPNLLTIQLESPTPYFLELTAFPTFFPVHQKPKTQVYNGPFTLKTWEPQRELILEKNPTYWDCSSVALVGITLSIIADSGTEGLLFEKNQLDWLGQPLSAPLIPEIMEKMKNDKQLHSYSIDGTFWLNFNTDAPPFNQVKFRKAFSYAVHRAALIEHILQGHQIPATGVVPPSLSSHHQPYFEDGNVTYARLLFEEALQELGSTTLSPITLKYSPSVRNTKIVQFLQDEWRKAFGIEVKLEALELHVHRTHLKQGHYQIATGEWVADYHDPLAFLEIFKWREGVNITNWNQDGYNQLLDRSRCEIDPLQRKELLSQAEHILIDAMPILPLYHYAFDYVKKDNVKDVVLSPLGTADFKWARKL